MSQLRFLILIVLDREGEGARLRSSEVAEKLDISRPVMTRTLQALEEERAIEIGGDAEDGRGRLVSLTQAGRKRIHAVLPG